MHTDVMIAPSPYIGGVGMIILSLIILSLIRV